MNLQTTTPRVETLADRVLEGLQNEIWNPETQTFEQRKPLANQKHCTAGTAGSYAWGDPALAGSLNHESTPDNGRKSILWKEA